LGIWFFKSSSELLYYDIENETEELILTANNKIQQEANYARACVFSADRSHMAFSLTQKVRASGMKITRLRAKKQEAPSRDQFYKYNHAICIYDLQKKEFWQFPIRCKNINWFEQ